MPRGETNGVETYYERHGEGRPVVFIHGAALDHRLWRPLVTALKAEYETVTYDYRGHGETGATDRERYSISLLAEDLRALVEELGLERPVLCGHSYGGLVAAEYAIQHPDDVAGVVFADARTDVGETLFEQVMFRVYQRLLRTKDLVGPERFERAWAFVANRFVDAQQGPGEVVPELGMKPSEYSTECARAVANAEHEKILSAGLAYVGASPTDLDVPVLYAYGELTAEVIAGKADRLERAPTGVRVATIENSGHGFPLEQPAAFAELLREFLEEAFAEHEVVASGGD